MVARYCGKVKIALTITSDNERYQCTLTARGKRLGSVVVGLPMHLEHSIDSPIAYDKAAHAALSFAMDEDERGEKDWGHLNFLLEHTDSGFVVRRAVNGKAAGTPTLAVAKKQLSALGMSLRKNEGEYRVTFQGVSPTRAEEVAHYTDDIDDAVRTGTAMSKERSKV